jgi:hypothetical protein
MIEFAKFFFHFPQVIGLLGTIAVIYFAFKMGSLEKSSKKRKLAISACIASAVLVVSGVWSGYEKEHSDAILLRTVKSNAELSGKIAEMTRENAALLTGGEHYCYFDPIETASNQFTWYLVRQGSGTPGPIYDISVSIIDINKLRSHEPSGTPAVPNPEALAGATESFSIGTMNPDESRIFRKIDLSGLKSQAYVIDFRARNGSWKQAICFELVDGKWTRAVRFRPLSPGAQSFILSDPWITGNFPSNAIP